MKVVVNDIAASKTGALSVLKDFYNHISEQGSGTGIEWVFVLGDRLLEERDNIRVLIRDDVKASRKNRLKFDLKTGAAYFESLKPDVLFSLQNTLPRGYRGRQVVYVHQPLSYQTWKKFSFFRPEEREFAIYQHLIGRMIDSSVRQADKVIVQTEWMKEAVVRKTGVKGDKVVNILPDITVPECKAFESMNNIVMNNDVINNNVIHFFYPSGEILYKNHACILEAVGILKDKGIGGYDVSFTLNKGDIPYLNRYPEYEEVKYIGRIDRNEVFRRYSRDVLLFPSYIETFGYPPAESRAVGGRMIVSDCPFCREVLNEYKRVKYFDPFDPKELAELMEKTVKGELFEDAEGNDGSEDNGRDRGTCDSPGKDKDDKGSWQRVIDEIIAAAG